VARVRVLAAAERWDEAVAAANSAVETHHRRSSTLKLRAEVLSWSGRHRAAIDAYDAYLGTAPDDLPARRQRARVAGWGGHFTEARRMYANLRAAFPDHPAIAAEADAKIAFYGGRWSTATRAYRRWLALEPDNGEARFEMAESLRAWGHVEQADATLEALESATGHRLATAARERVTMNRQPAVTLFVRERGAEGYEGRRQLSVRQQGGSFAAGLGTSGRTPLFSEGTSVLAQGADVDRHGYRLGVGGIHRMRPTLQLEGRAAWWDFGRANKGAPQLLLRADWRVADRWTLSGGVERELILENVTTIDRSVAGAGVFVGGHLQSPNGSLDLRTAWQELSDGNARQRTSASVSRVLGERLSHVRAVAWAEALSYRRTSSAYFAPSRLLRLDAGLQYAHRFSQPRFQGDRVGELVASYLVGTDDRGTRYQQPSMRLALEISRGLVVDAHAGWIRAATYNETSISIGLRITGGGR